MKKVLILGGSHRDIPLINAAKKLGYYVITLGDRDYYKGHHFSDKTYKIDFNDLDAVRKIIKNEKITYLLPGCGEESYLNTVKLAHEFKIGNYDQLDIAQLVHNKWKFKEFCLKNDISTPKGIFYNKQLDLTTLKFPVVVKPTNLSGGRGVDIVKDVDSLQTALISATNLSKEIFLEEFIEGELFAYSVFIKNQKVVYGFSGKDETYLNNYLITSAYPVELSQKIKDKLDTDINNLAKNLSLVDGMFHLQFLVKEEIPYIIDVTRRIAGDFYPYLIEFCDHIQYSMMVIKAYIGQNIDTELLKTKKEEFVIRHVVMPNQNGIYKGLTIDSSIKKNIMFEFHLLEKESLIEDYLNTQISILFLRMNHNNKDMIRNINKLLYPIVN